MTHDLAIVGPLPPPVGGISRHVERLLPYLDKEGIDYFVYNTGGPTEIPGQAVSVASNRGWWFFRYLLFGKERAVYLISDEWEAWAANWFLSRVRRRKVVLAMHGPPRIGPWESVGRLRRWLITRGFRCAAGIVVVNTHVYEYLMKIGDFSHKTLIAPAYIPPVCRSEHEQTVSAEIRTFAEQHDPVILGIGAPVLRKNNTDLYGIDMTIELADRLRESYPRIGVLWFLLDFAGSLPEYAQEMRREVKQRGLEANWLFCSPLAAFYAVYKLADVFVRPTMSDGDALSVREAMHFGVPAVVSDAAPRPACTIEFRTRDQADYERVVRHTLENLDAERERLVHRPSETAVNEEVALLQEVMAEAKA